MAYVGKKFMQCVECGHQLWVTSWLNEEGSSKSYDNCPDCGSKLKDCDPSLAEKKLGDLSKCGRCQKKKLGSNSADVRNAPEGVYSSWCFDCINAVNNGAPPILLKVSIDKEGFIINPAQKDTDVKPRDLLLGTIIMMFGAIGSGFFAINTDKDPTILIVLTVFFGLFSILSLFVFILSVKNSKTN